MRVSICILSSLIIAGAADALAQDTRAEAHAAEQQQKASTLTPSVPGRAEQTLLKFKRELIDDPNGFYPSFQTVYSGGGMTGGIGYRRYYAPHAFWNVLGSYSVKGYNLLEVSTTTTDLLDSGITLSLRAGRREATAVEYWGIGNDTLPDGTSEFEFTQLYAGALAQARISRFGRIGGGVEYDDYEDTADVPLAAPAFGASPDYIHAQAMAAFDSRTSPGYSRVGGLYGAAIHSYRDQNGGANSFERLDVDLIQHLPLFRENWVVSLRGRVQTTLGDDAVPYLLMPSVGGGSSLRGYSSWRFRDLHTLLTQAEWRWFPNWDGVDMAFFFDAGKVAPTRDGLDFSGMHTDWGVGGRFHGAFATPLRIDLAHGAEGWHLNFSGSAAF
jgi:surface antigen Omp85-like protein